MQARKAYISSLGTTGLLVASSLLILVVVGALVAFDRWPNQAAAETETVPITDTTPRAVRPADPARVLAGAERRAATRALAGSHSARALRAASRRAAAGANLGRAGTGSGSATAGATSGAVISDLPAPDTAPAQSGSPAQATAPGAGSSSSPGSGPLGGGGSPLPLPPTPIAQTGGDALSALTDQVGGTVMPVSPSLAESVRGTGPLVEGLLGGG